MMGRRKGTQQRTREANQGPHLNNHRQHGTMPHQSYTVDYGPSNNGPTSKHRGHPHPRPHATTLPHPNSTVTEQGARGNQSYLGNFQRNLTEPSGNHVYCQQHPDQRNPPNSHHERSGFPAAVARGRSGFNSYQSGQLGNHPEGNIHQSPEYQEDKSSWPLCAGEKVVVHLNEPGNTESLHPGDSYFCVRQSQQGNVDVVLRQVKESHDTQDYTLTPDDSHSGLFQNMDSQRTESGLFDSGFSCNNDEDIVELLSRCIVSAEQGLERLTWEQVKSSARSEVGCRDEQMEANRRRTPVGVTAHGGHKTESGYHTNVNEAKVIHRKCPDGSLVKEELPVCGEKVEVPTNIKDMHPHVLLSGAVIMPGCRDRRGGAVIIMFCRHSAWEQEDGFNAIELAKFLLYYYSSISEERRKLGLTIIVDARGTSLNSLNVLLKTLYNLETSQPHSIHIVHVLADRVAQALLFKSSVFRPQMNITIGLVTSVETLYKFVEASVLPVDIGGRYNHCHQDWIHFRQIVDPFLAECRSGAHFLLRVMQEMSLTQGMPETSREAAELMEQHEECVGRALEEPVLQSLQTSGEDTLTLMKEELMKHASHHDYRESYDNAKKLFTHVKESMFRLVKLADDKLHRLEQCLQLRQFEEKVTTLLDWLCRDGEDLLQEYRSPADNLKGIHAQQTHFEQAYYTAMSQIEKGNALLEEGSMLSQSDELEQVTGIKEISKELKGRMKGFTGHLEEVRENIENTGHCYKMLDKCYEWALEAMKYVASMKMDKDLESPDLNQLLTSLEDYMNEHPPISQEVFAELESTATTVDNDRLSEQCKVARSRCLETEQLLEVRHSTLKKAKEQMDIEQDIEQERRDSLTSLNSSCIGTNTPIRTPVSSPATSLNSSVVSSIPVRSPNASSHHNFGPIVYRDRGASTASSNHGNNRYWQKETCCTPVGPSLEYVLRRRSYAGKPSAPVYSPSVAAFKENMQGVSLFEYEEYLFSEGLITEDMSDRIVTSLPKALSDSTLKSSRESLRGSQENVAPDGNVSSVASSTQETASTATSKSGTSQSSSHNTSSSSSITKSIASRTSSLIINLSKHSKPQRKMMRRAVSATVSDSALASPSSSSLRDNSGDVIDRRASSKTLSMMTSQSSESLSGLPEEDSLDNSAQAERRQMWTPLPSPHTHHRGEGAHHHPFVSQSMADLRLTEEDVKRRRQLQLIMTEMIQTEQDYVSALKLIQDHYIPETSRDDVPQALRGKRNIIFGNIEKIYEFHSQYFLSELESCMHNPYMIAQCFLNHEAEFFLYALYNKNKPKSDGLMLDYGRRFFRAKQTELGDKMDLSSYLLKPVQRMGKYSLLLKQIIKECPPSEPEYADLRTAYEMVKFQLRHGNDLLAMDCLVGADVNLQEQGMLLRQDTFLVFRGRRKAIRHVFLFEDMIVFSKTKRTSLGKEVYVYKNSIKLSDLGLTENTGDSRYKFEIWFRKLKGGDTYTLQAPTAEVKAEWVREISRLLWQQAIKNRDRRLNEMARMGAGHKPCIDLKPSADNIQDRFVNCSLTSRLPRVRNSIAVFNLDHLKNGSKRPHSLISVGSSTSSSGSSGMYGGGPLSITFESPYESAYEADMSKTELPRSATMCSNESGIVADLASNPSSPVKEDAFTQTTLKRPVKTGQSQQSTAGTDIDSTRLSLVAHSETFPDVSNV